MKLHIVMVALNNAKMTQEAMESIVSPMPYSIHLMDQESSEQFDLSGFDSLYRRFSPRVSLSEAWNVGINEALEDPECEYIFIPNNDVVFHNVTISALIWGLDNLGYAMVTGENVAPRYTIDDFKAIESPGSIEFDKRPITNWREEGPDFSCFMIGRNFVDKFGYFDENFYPAYCEDQDMHVRIVKGGSHAKRLTTAPYYHFGSRTVVNNTNLIGIISQGHEKNKGYYRQKWGNEHPSVLDGQGFATPYNEPDRDIKYWRGSEKYERGN